MAHIGLTGAGQKPVRSPGQRPLSNLLLRLLGGNPPPPRRSINYVSTAATSLLVFLLDVMAIHTAVMTAPTVPNAVMTVAKSGPEATVMGHAAEGSVSPGPRGAVLASLCRGVRRVG